MATDSTDPRWSAYVLSELDADETARAETELRSSPEAQRMVAELRESAFLLGLALKTSPALELSPRQRRALEKARKASLASASPADRSDRNAAPARRRTWRRLALTGMTAGALGVAAVVILLVQPLLGERAWLPLMSASVIPVATAPALAPEMRFEIATPPTNAAASLAVSPDGKAIVYVAMTQPFSTAGPWLEATGNTELWIRAFDAVTPRLLFKGHLTSFPFWSPDGRSVAFFADGKLKRIRVDGGTAVVLADAPDPRGGTWGVDGTILFSAGTTGTIRRVPAAGGAAMPVTRLRAPQQKGHRFPVFLPDGERFLFHVQGDEKERGIHLGTLSSGEARRLVDAEAAVPGPEPGQLLLVRDRTLIAQSFDATAQQLRGAPSPIAEDVFVEPGSGAAAVSASAAGPIVYRGGTPRSSMRLGQASAIAISPDGRWLAYQRNDSGQTDIWVMPFGTDGKPVSAGAGQQPVWRRDGSELFWLDPDGQLVSGRVAKSPEGGGLQIAPPSRVLPEWAPGSDRVVFARDGRYIAVPAPPIVVVLNWTPQPVATLTPTWSPDGRRVHLPPDGQRVHLTPDGRRFYVAPPDQPAKDPTPPIIPPTP
jgi:hypothetical protein